MKTLIGIVIIAAVLYVANTLTKEYKKVEKTGDYNAPASAQNPATPQPSTLPGLPESLERNLAIAQQQGVAGLKKFLTDFDYAIKDPRRAEIELDYVVLLSRTDPVEDNLVYAGILARTPANSPVYQRVKRYESTFK